MTGYIAVVGMLLLWLAVGGKLLLTRRTAAGRGVRMLSFALLMLAGSMTVDLDAVYLPLDRSVGSVNLACLLVYGQALTAVWAFYMVLDRFLARSLSGPAAGSRRGYVELAVALSATVVMFWFGPAWLPDTPKLDAHPYTSVGSGLWFAVVIGAGCYFTLRAVLGAAHSAAYAGRTGRPTVAVGLWLVALGGALGVVNNCFQVFVATAYRSPAITATSDALTGAGFLAAGCVAVGISLPAVQWSVVSGAWLRPVQERWAYAALRPLWRDLLAVAPEVALDSRSGIHGGWLAVRDARYRLYRRVIEIRDAALVVRPHARPSARRAVLQSGQLRGLHGQALLADAEAALLAHAIAACLASATPPGQDPPEASAATAPGGPRWAAEPGAGEAEDEDTYGGSLAQEVEWLLAVARCYRRHTQPAATCPQGRRPAELGRSGAR